MGRVSNDKLLKYYQAANIYVQPSRDIFLEHGFIDLSEGMGRTFCEAGACKLPIIATNSGGIPSVVKHMENGFLLDDPSNVELLKDKISYLINNENVRLKVSFR